jgi:hypothetical protein
MKISLGRFYIKIITDAIEDPSPLTDWEYDFIQSMAEKEAGDSLSEKQAKTLNRIGEKYA